MKSFTIVSHVAAVLTMGAIACGAPPADDLASGFHVPPDSAKPHTWWHWMNGNVTREGITADLEAMKRIGLGGAQIFNVSEDIPPGPVVYNSPEWRALVKHAASEADRLGLELCIHNCAGWSSSGGPWVEPMYAMQTVVTSEVHVQGPSGFAGALTQPRTNMGYYRDIAVLAFPTPKDDVTRIADIQAKALYEYRYGLGLSHDAIPAEATIRKKSIVDLSAQFKDGILRWDIPAGDWTILRIGHTPTGAMNAPAPKSGRGLEVDKMSREAFDHYWAGGMEPLLKELGPLAGKSVRNVLIDSYEVGCQNWSPTFRAEFTRRRGYDPLMFLPTMTGRIVEGGGASEQFLWDLRRTVSDLYTENYYAYFAEKCRANGLLASVEPYDGPFECTQVGRDADIVMGEFWVNADMRSSCKLAASVAHVFGKPIVGAESFTAMPGVGGWRNHPASLKAVGDLMYCEGINRCIIHRYAHQPWLNIEPGMTMGQWGTHFERTTTWWDHGGPEWISYLSRCQYLLQQGTFAADVLYFAGVSAPNGAPHVPALKARGYDYDSCGMDAIRKAAVRDGRIVLAGGMAYRVLVLPESAILSAEAVRVFRDLVRQGASVQTETQGAWDIASSEVIAPPKGVDPRGVPVEQTLAKMNITPDAVFKAANGAAVAAAWIHRVVGGSDVYFVSNQKPRSAEFECSFRVVGKVPELWDPESGRVEVATNWRVEGDRTIVTSQFAPAGSVFVVFRPEAESPHVLAVHSLTAAAEHVPRVEVVKARYEATDAAGGADVTAQVASLVAAGATEIAASNGNFGDPIPNHVKRLKVEFTIDGKPASREAAENSVLVLMEPGPDRAASYSLERVERGVELRAFRADEIEVRMSDGKTHRINVAAVPAAVEVGGPWSVSFQAGRGAPARAEFARLESWSASSDAGIRYFAGTAAYETEFDLPEELAGAKARASRVLMLDLGSVHEVAECTLNGKKLTTLWKPPYQVDISGVAVPGRNHLTVKVTNVWINRLIGDEQLPADADWARAAPSPLKSWPEWFASESRSATAGLSHRTTRERLTFTTWKHWTKDSPLVESGLLGPVVVRVGERRLLTGEQ